MVWYSLANARVLLQTSVWCWRASPWCHERQPATDRGCSTRPGEQAEKHRTGCWCFVRQCPWDSWGDPAHSTQAKRQDKEREIKAGQPQTSGLLAGPKWNEAESRAACTGLGSVQGLTHTWKKQLLSPNSVLYHSKNSSWCLMLFRRPCFKIQKQDPLHRRGWRRVSLSNGKGRENLAFHHQNSIASFRPWRTWWLNVTCIYWKHHRNPNLRLEVGLYGENASDIYETLLHRIVITGLA